jgi:membrane-bound serine protease (ClpP class)
VWLVALALTVLSPTLAQSGTREVVVIEADGPVIPPLRSYIQRGIEEAEERNAEALVIMLNTPGGSLKTTQEIVQDIRASQVPVIVYIAPRGAIAASAGTIITLAGHASAMAPETAVGAASPVGGQGEDLPETLAAKEGEILSAQARSLAEPRGPEAVRLAEEAVLEARAANANEALEANFVDFVAFDVVHMLEQADGLEVTVDNEKVTLHTANAVQHLLEMTLLERFLIVLVDPTIVFVLMSIGTTAIIIEISSPGGWAAGAIGVTCLGLALYGLGVLPVNWLGGIFILMSFVLFILDVKATTHGALTTAALISMIAGSVMLFNTPEIAPFGSLSIPVVVVVSLLIAALFVFVVGKALQTQAQQPFIGSEGMVGMTGRVVQALEPEGVVLVASERWRAQPTYGADTIPEGASVEVVEVKGFTMKVRLVALPPAETTENEAVSN